MGNQRIRPYTKDVDSTSDNNMKRARSGALQCDSALSPIDRARLMKDKTHTHIYTPQQEETTRYNRKFNTEVHSKMVE